jgi:hypothetical protein
MSVQIHYRKKIKIPMRRMPVVWSCDFESGTPILSTPRGDFKLVKSRLEKIREDLKQIKNEHQRILKELYWINMVKRVAIRKTKSQNKLKSKYMGKQMIAYVLD